MMDEKRYLNQIDKFYNGSLTSNQIIRIGETPEYLLKLGAEALPIVVKQSTLAKCIRKPRGSRSAHNLDREMIESLPRQISEPILVVDERERNAFALISDYRDKNNNNMLIALKLKANVRNMEVNEVVSFYGRSNLKIYLEKQPSGNVYIIDNTKVRTLPSLLRLQLPTTLKASDSRDKIAYSEKDVNNKFSVQEKLRQYQQEIKASDAERNIPQHDRDRRER